MDDVLFDNVRLESDCEYFLYIGEIKTHCLNPFVKTGLERRFERRFEAVSICPDALTEYPPGNLLVINPWVAGKPRTAERRPMDRFAAHVSGHDRVRSLIDHILSRQKKLYIWMFETKRELALADIPGVELLGPDPKLVYSLNDKTWQYEALRDLVPVVDFCVCSGRQEMLDACESMQAACRDGIFVSCDYSAGGVSSMVVKATSEAACRFEAEGRYLVSRYVPHMCDPTVLGVVGNENDVFIAGVADMHIEDGNKFRGSTFPSQLPAEVQRLLRDHSAVIGRRLGKLGFRGIFGCDFIVAPDHGVFFIEVNPRKQGTTMEFCCAMHHLLPEGAPNLPELEMSAVLDDRFPDGWTEPDHDAALTGALHWGTYNNKIEKPGVRTFSHPGQEMPEPELFARVAEGGPGGYVVLEHVGDDVAVMPGTFLGRVAAVGGTREEMLAAREEGRTILAASIVDAALENEEA